MKYTKPTTLYVKQCGHCGKKYFGKTVSKDVHAYRGSGKLWKLHLAKYKPDVVTTVVGVFHSEPELVKFALHFSEVNDIVASDDWFNLKPETGIDGGDNNNKEGQKLGGRVAMTKMHKEGRFNHGQRNRENGLMKAIQNMQYSCSCGRQFNAGNLVRHLKSNPTHTRKET